MGIEELQNRVLALIPDHLYCEKEQASIHFEIFRMQAVKIIAPPLEWITQTHGLWYSTDLKHRIVKTDTGFEWQRKLPNVGLEKWERMFEKQTFEDIESVINEWRQIGVNQAIEGCKLE